MGIGYHAQVRYLLLITIFVVGACDKSSDGAASADSKLLGERLIAKHGEGLLASPVLVVYDSGFIVGSGSLDPEFANKVAGLGLRPTGSISGGALPVAVRDYYSEEGVELAVSEPDRLVVVDATSSLTIRLLFGTPGITALRACEAVKVDRMCKAGGELRARLDDIQANGAEIIDRGEIVARGELQPNWAIFKGAPELSDDAQLELLIGDGVRCNLSKWLVDPRDSCTM